MIRTITAPPPNAHPGRAWIAWALHEAPDHDGQPGTFQCIEAGPGPLNGPVMTKHAAHDPGWYMVQWHDDQQTSMFSTPERHPRTAERGTVGRR